jgi:hypothetical protein
MVIGHLEITTWCGISIGAVHWYCNVIIEKDSNDVEWVKIERPLSSKETVALNKEARERGLLSDKYKAGEMTEGFNTEEEAIAAGIKYFESKYHGLLFDGGYGSYSAWKKIIRHPTEFTSLVTKMNQIADSFQSLNGYECQKNKKKIVERLDKRWYKYMITLQELCKSYV